MIKYISKKQYEKNLKDLQKGYEAKKKELDARIKKEGLSYDIIAEVLKNEQLHDNIKKLELGDADCIQGEESSKVVLL